MRILISGFEPFGGETINPSWKLAVALKDDIPGAEAVLVPVTYQDAVKTVTRRIKEYRPDVVLMLGQAGGRKAMTIERVAINVMDACIPDNNGFRPFDAPIDSKGPAAYFTTLPMRGMIDRMNAAGVLAGVSNTAGTYVCNTLMYGVLRFIEQEGLLVRAGFIHVPYLDEQARNKKGVPSMPLDAMVRGLGAALKAL